MWVTDHARVCDVWRADTPLTARGGALYSACCSVQMPRQQIDSADSSSGSIIHAQRILSSRITSLSCTARTAEQERRARRAFPCKSVRIRPLLAAAFHAIRMHSLPISMYGGEYWLGIIYTIVMASFNPLFALSHAAAVERALTQLSLLGAR
jgi:hypothetical protein